MPKRTKIDGPATPKQIADALYPPMRMRFMSSSGIRPLFRQKAELHRLGEQVRVLPIPLHCPQLNPTEDLWALVKGEVANTVYSTLGRTKRR